MRRIFLLRHAKSSWGIEGQEDFDRPLNQRGRKSVPALGEYIQAHGIAPDLILCSTARRTRETLALLLPFLRGEATVRLEDRLYLAPADTLAAALKHSDNAVRQVLIIAHNPGIQELALSLVAKDGSEARRAIEAKFPTAALAEIDLSGGPWSSLEPHAGTLVRFVTPRSLMQD